MTDELKALIEAAKSVEQNTKTAEKQRRSFAYGNTKFENDLITWDIVNEQADLLDRKSAG